MKKKVILIVVLVLVILGGGLTYWLLAGKSAADKKASEEIKKAVDYDFAKYGDVTYDKVVDDGEESVYLVVKLKSAKEVEAIERELVDRRQGAGAAQLNFSEINSEYQKMKDEKKISAWYDFMLDGKKNKKTGEIQVFIMADDAGYYVFVAGIL